MHAGTLHWLTEADYLALPESNARQELLDGELSVSPSPSLLHQIIVGRLFRRLAGWAEQASLPAMVALAPVDIRFAPDRILQPDLSVFVGALPGPDDRPITQIPRLCVEVASPSTRVVDRVLKRLLYAEAGVAEYWVVDPAGAVERFDGEGLRQVSTGGDLLESSTLPGLRVPLAALFER